MALSHDNVEEQDPSTSIQRFKPAEEIVDAVKFDGSERSAVFITRWLFERGTRAYYQKLFGPIVDKEEESATELKTEIALNINTTFGFVPEGTWVYVREGEVKTATPEEFDQLFTPIKENN